jgi:DNA-binding response OmpR family regulator
MRVFIAEDDASMREALAAALGASGYETTEARDGANLLELLEDAMSDPGRCPDVIVADVRMPVLSGFGILSALRRAQTNIPVVLITAMRDPSMHTVAVRLGAMGFLQKPFGMEDLLSAVRSAFDHHRAADRLAGLDAGGHRRSGEGARVNGASDAGGSRRQ